MKTNNLLEAIEKRFSPLIFVEEEISDETIELLLKAATTAASSYNAQPWRFIYGKKGSETYRLLRSTLSEYNQAWTETAPLLMLSIAKTLDDKQQPNYYAFYDTGMAVATMAIQASAMGLQLHQMGGYDLNKTKELFKIPQGYEPAAMIAIGRPGDINKLQGHFLERAKAPRNRLNIKEISGCRTFFERIS